MKRSLRTDWSSAFAGKPILACLLSRFYFSVRTTISYAQVARRIGAPLLNRGAGHLDQYGARSMLAPDQRRELVGPQANLGLMTRASESTGPPAGKGTMMRTGLLG